VLNCAVAAVLFERFPAIPEGELSRVRASLVNRDTLARLARELALGARSISVKAKSGVAASSGRRFSPMRSRRYSARFSSTPASTPHAP
jgi:dsRNA-specific ribonuclease